MDKTIQIICVDDDIAMHHLLPKVLELAGICTLAWYKSAEELLEMRESKGFQDAALFLFDFHMPNMTGVELAAELRSSGEKRPILLTSAYSYDFRWGLREMDVEFMQKPYDFDLLELKIKNLAQQSMLM